MRVTNLELYEALVIIKKVCSEHTTCADCPLFSDKEEDYCSLSSSEQIPTEWQLNAPDVYRAIS